MHFPYPNSTSNLFLDIDDKKKHPKIQIHQTLASQTYHHLKNAQGHDTGPPGRRPNQTAHLKLLQQQNNVLHQQAKAKVQGTHNILTTNSISTLHKIEMV